VCCAGNKKKKKKKKAHIKKNKKIKTKKQTKKKKTKKKKKKKKKTKKHGCVIAPCPGGVVGHSVCSRCRAAADRFQIKRSARRPFGYGNHLSNSTGGRKR
jgi:hypothetical protein